MPSGKMGKTTVMAVVALAVVAIVLLSVRARRNGNVEADPPAGKGARTESSGRTAKISDLAPDFALKDLGGTEVRLSDQRGKVVLIDFWATWCPPCREELPHIQRLHEDHRSEGLVVLALSTDRDPAAVRTFVPRHGFTFPVLFGNREVATAYRVRGIPTVYLVDRQGRIRFHHVGYNRGAERDLEREILQLWGSD